MSNAINNFHYGVETTGSLSKDVHNRYIYYQKGRSIEKRIQELQNNTSLSNPKAKDSEQGVLNKEEENQIANDSTLTQLGQTVWDSVFKENNPELPSIMFMRKVKQTN